MGATDENQPPDPSDYGFGIDSLGTADILLRWTQYVLALVLLIGFVSGAAWYSVFNAKKEEDLVQPTVKGPGGKPLPTTRRKKRNDGERKLGPRFGLVAKNFFRYMAAIVFLSYIGTAVSMFMHAFYYDDPHEWSKKGLPWAGEWTVVRLYEFVCLVDYWELLPGSSPVGNLPVPAKPYHVQRPSVTIAYAVLELTYSCCRFMSQAVFSSTYTFSSLFSTGRRDQTSSIFRFGFWGWQES